MVKKSIKKEIIGYNNFARSLIIKEKQIIQDEEKKENRIFYLKIVVFFISAIFISVLVTKTLKRNPDITNFIYSSV